MSSTRPIRRFEKIISKPSSELEEFLFNIREGSYSGYSTPILLQPYAPLNVRKEEQSFEATYANGSKLFITPDHQSHSISIEGEWWYRGVYRLEEVTRNQTKLIYEVYNAAPQFRWLIPFVVKSKNKMAAGFNLFVERLQLEMGDPIRRKAG